MTSESPPDPGLQAERTSLAWRRTALSVAVGSLVGLRLLPSHVGALGYAASALGVLWSLDLVLSSRRRYRDGLRLLRRGAGSTTAGATVARTAGLAGVLAAVALAYVVVVASR